MCAGKWYPYLSYCPYRTSVLVHRQQDYVWTKYTEILPSLHLGAFSRNATNIAVQRDCDPIARDFVYFAGYAGGGLARVTQRKHERQRWETDGFFMPIDPSYASCLPRLDPSTYFSLVQGVLQGILQERLSVPGHLQRPTARRSRG